MFTNDDVFCGLQGMSRMVIFFVQIAAEGAKQAKSRYLPATLTLFA